MCGYCNGYYGSLNNYFGLGLFCEVLLWRSILEDMILESWVWFTGYIGNFHKDWGSLSSFFSNSRVLSACQTDTEDTLSLVVEKSGQRTGGNRSANS